MKKATVFILLLTGSLLFVQCKDDVKDEGSEAQKTEIKQTKATEVKQAPLTQEQKAQANGLMTKLMKNKDTKEFARALVSAGLLTKLDDLSIDVTIFAPSNTVFTSLPAGKNVLNDQSRKEELVAMLNMHMVKGTITSADLVQQIMQNTTYTMTTVSDQKLIATMKGDSILITNETAEKTVVVGKSDIKSTNGMLHLVNGFLQ